MTCTTIYTHPGAPEGTPCATTTLVETNVQFSWDNLNTDDHMREIATSSKGVFDYTDGYPLFRGDDTHTYYVGREKSPGEYAGIVQRYGNVITFSMNESRGSWYSCTGPLYHVTCSGATILLPPAF